jgi:hypothetical protein
LQDAGDVDLSTLLAKASEKIPDNQCLVIVVDALDEVEQDFEGTKSFKFTQRFAEAGLFSAD